jgi:hypothetical protein
MERSGIHRSSTSAADSAGTRSVNIVGKGTGEASDQGDAKGVRGRAGAVQVEGQGEVESR